MKSKRNLCEFWVQLLTMFHEMGDSCYVEFIKEFIFYKKYYIRIRNLK